MHWIYILKCENGIIYVGETTRFFEHFGGKGGINTSTNQPDEIVAIYKVNNLINFIEYNRMVIAAKKNIVDYNPWLFDLFDKEEEEDDECLKDVALEVENNITERMMIFKKDKWKKVRGGKYTKNGCKSCPINTDIEKLPICNCGFPCDVKKNDKNQYLYFRCAKKNMWDGFKDEFMIDSEPCKFFSKYIEDADFIKIDTCVKCDQKFNKRKPNHQFCNFCFELLIDFASSDAPVLRQFGEPTERSVFALIRN